MRIIQSTIILSFFASGASATGSSNNAPPIKVNPKIPGANLQNDKFQPIDEGNKILNLCESDCDEDKDCAPGLLCAAKHQEKLRAIGLDDRAANCYNVKKPWNYEVCFDPKIFGSGGAGGGTLIYGITILQWLSK